MLGREDQLIRRHRWQPKVLDLNQFARHRDDHFATFELSLARHPAKLCADHRRGRRLALSDLGKRRLIPTASRCGDHDRRFAVDPQLNHAGTKGAYVNPYRLNVF